MLNTIEVDFKVLYHEDGFLFLQGKKYPTEVLSWLICFQEIINLHAYSTALRFSATVWNEGETPVTTLCKKKTLVSVNYLPLLVMELYCRMDELAFQVYKKPNQLLKYLNVESNLTGEMYK